MSAEAVNAISAQAHKISAEAEAEADRSDQEVSPAHKHWLAKQLHEIARRMQGYDPAADAAAQDQAGSTSGLAVQRTDEAGNPVPAPPDAGTP